MSNDDAQKFLDQIKAGNFNLSELEKMSVETVQPVTVSGWEACYSSTTGQLSGYCTVTADNSGDTVTGCGLVIYKSDGTVMFCLQYSNGFNDVEINTSVGTNLYTTSMGSSVLSIVYGYTQNSGMYFFNQTLSVGSC
ncbi:MAG TPA: hypothetical protein VGO50_05690 [Pyrinomonadaceae bacterium]|jgi:hypothetical protein|nr:hypothetical protein [Pyrinomonadaceae bacterium]